MNSDEARAAIRRGLSSRQTAQRPFSPNGLDIPRGSRCVLCNAGPDVVAYANRMLGSGATAAMTWRALDPVNEGRRASGHQEISYQTVQRHARDHLPGRLAAVREIVERRARLAQLDPDEGTTNVLTAAAYAEAMMTKAMQDMEEAEITPADGLQAAKFLTQLMQAERGNVGIEAAFAELGYIIEAVKEVVPQQYWQAVVDKIEEKRGSRIIAEAHVSEEFDPGDQPEEEFTPPDDGDEDF